MLQPTLMAKTADVVIIGAGFAGAATAFHLAERGVEDVVLVEQEPAPGRHASGRNASLVFQLIENLDEARLAIEGRRFYEAPSADFEAPLLRARGSLLVTSDPAGASLETARRDAAALGIAASVVSPEDAAARVPPLRSAPIAVALESPTDCVVDIRALLAGYLRGAERRGARLHAGERVTAIRACAGRVTEVRTSGMTIHTRTVVNAAGAWAGEVGRLAGVGARTLAPRRRHLYQTRADPSVDAAWPFVWHADVDVYFRPQSGGLLTSPCDADPHPERAPEVDPAAERRLREKLARAFPALARAAIDSSWACLRTFARDGRFVIGRDPELEGLVWVAALGGHGMSTSYAVGRLGATAVLGGTSAELERFSPARLA